MSEKITKGYKISQESKQHIEELFAGSEFNDQGDFLLHMASLYEMQKLKNNEVAGYAKQLDELDFHTRRISELFLSMVMVEQTSRVRVGEEHAERVGELSSVISSQHDEIRQLSEDLGKAAALTGNMQKQIEELEKHVQQLQQANERGEDLISEYKTRFDSFSGLLASQAEEVNQAKALQSQLTELTKLTDDQRREIEQLSALSKQLQATADKERKETSERHVRELQDAKFRADLEADKALVNLRRELQDELSNERSSHMVEIRKLYAEINDMRQQLTMTIKGASDRTTKQKRNEDTSN
ncbi:hypothetical protein [Paenibacillus tepidiphilus]|uniref:hypothetical protein n=1 Tax=Paenibacillus tepidiphilus TaxID=2608683 RepID=UPI00123A1DC0|nr:hypothetical protein [Paenibacillus tepidiphilus]